MSKPLPSLPRILATVKSLCLTCRKRDARGRKAVYSDELIVALVIFERVWQLGSSQQTLLLLATFGEQVPAPSTYCERKQKLIGVILLALRQFFVEGLRASRLHLDSKKLAVCSRGRAKRTKLPGAYGVDIANQVSFFGLRLHTLVDDLGELAALKLKPANLHDVSVAAELLAPLRYKVVTGDKGYVSARLRRYCSLRTVDFIARRRSNQIPHTVREQNLYRHHRRVETVFSQFERLGLSRKQHTTETGLYLHIFSVVLAYCVLQFIKTYPAIGLTLVQLHSLKLFFPNRGSLLCSTNS